MAASRATGGGGGVVREASTRVRGAYERSASRGRSRPRLKAAPAGAARRKRTEITYIRPRRRHDVSVSLQRSRVRADAHRQGTGENFSVRTSIPFGIRACWMIPFVVLSE